MKILQDIDPALLVDPKGRVRVTLPKGTVVFLNAAPFTLINEAVFDTEVQNLWHANLM